jgi:hypothetical protein
VARVQSIPLISRLVRQFWLWKIIEAEFPAANLYLEDDNN